MNNPSSIERVVMRRIFFIRLLRPFVSGGAVATLLCLLALWGVGQEVWVARILENAPKHIADLPRFYISAFNHTHLTVQALMLLTLASLAYLAREIARTVSSVFIQVHA